MKRRSLGFAASICMLLACAPATYAHDFPAHTIVVHDGHSVVHHRDITPHWMQRQRPFQQWYLTSHYRHNYRLSWLQLYDLYRADVIYHRPYRHIHRGGCRHDRDGHHRHHKRR